MKRLDPATYDHRCELALALLRTVRDYVLPPKHPLRAAVAATIREADGDEPTVCSVAEFASLPRPQTPLLIVEEVNDALQHLLAGAPDSAEWRLAIAYLRLARLIDGEPDLVPAPHRQDLAHDFARRPAATNHAGGAS